MSAKQPLPDVPADAAIKKEWATDGFGANSQNFFQERLKRQGSTADAAGFEHYTIGGGNTPYVFGDWVASADDPTLMQWRTRRIGRATRLIWRRAIRGWCATRMG